MEPYSFFNIPETCRVDSKIHKKLFYENADLSKRNQELFTQSIDKITWCYALKPENLHVAAYQDEIRDYPEIEVIEVLLREEKGLNRIAEIVMRTIPYPMLLIFKLDKKIRLYVAHQRTSQSDSSKNTLEELIATGWLEAESDLFEKLNIKNMRFTDFYALYSDLVDVISIYKLSEVMKTKDAITGAEARELSAKLEGLEQKIFKLQSQLKKETQFNRKMELNIEIKKLEGYKDGLISKS